MVVTTEATLRSACPLGRCDYAVPSGSLVTESARQFAKARGIRLVEADYEVITWSRPPEGIEQAEKPEEMTHLRAGELVKKTDLRIRFRGKLDSFQADVLVLMATAHRVKNIGLINDLDDVLRLCRNILAAEVKQEPLPDWTLFGMDEQALHTASHTPPHPVPDYRMGETAMMLNRLRALSRELELAWLAAYPPGERSDIVLALNRLSSAIYLLFRKEVKQHG